MEILQKKSPIKRESLSTKEGLRPYFLLKRKAISDARRNHAALSLLSLLDSLKEKTQVFSFKSFKSEIDTSLINERLALEGRLFLPEIDGENLNFKAEVTSSTVILVPGLAFGLAFDGSYHRLGYGKGFYDRFLSEHSVLTIGIGFKEQFIEELPTESHDKSLSSLYLV